MRMEDSLQHLLILFVIPNVALVSIVIFLYWKLRKAKRQLKFMTGFLTRRLRRQRHCLEKTLRVTELGGQPSKDCTLEIAEEGENDLESKDCTLEIAGEEESDLENNSESSYDLDSNCNTSEESLFWREEEEIGGYRKLVSSDSETEFESWV